MSSVIKHTSDKLYYHYLAILRNSSQEDLEKLKEIT